MKTHRIVIVVEKASAEKLAIAYLFAETVENLRAIHNRLVELTGSEEGANRLERQARLAYDGIA